MATHMSFAKLKVFASATKKLIKTHWKWLLRGSNFIILTLFPSEKCSSQRILVMQTVIGIFTGFFFFVLMKWIVLLFSKRRILYIWLFPGQSNVGDKIFKLWWPLGCWYFVEVLILKSYFMHYAMFNESILSKALLHNWLPPFVQYMELGLLVDLWYNLKFWLPEKIGNVDVRDLFFLTWFLLICYFLADWGLTVVECLMCWSHLVQWGEV